jgi:hypothetical protein
MKYFLGYYFPWHFRMLAWIVLIGSAFTLLIVPDLSLKGWALLGILLGYPIVSAGYCLWMRGRQFTEIFSFWKWSPTKPIWKQYTTQPEFFINHIKERQGLALGPVSNTIYKQKYQVFIKFSEGDKILLFSDRKKEKVIARLNRLNLSYQFNITDYCS